MPFFFVVVPRTGGCRIGTLRRRVALTLTWCVGTWQALPRFLQCIWNWWHRRAVRACRMFSPRRMRASICPAPRGLPSWTMIRRRSRQSQAGCYTFLVAHWSLEHLVPPGTRPWLPSSTAIPEPWIPDRGLKLAPLSCRSTRAFCPSRKAFHPVMLGRSTLKRGGHGLTASAASQRPSPYRLLGFWLTPLSCRSTRAFCPSRNW